MVWDKPRDPARIDGVLSEVERYWREYPHLRLGQVVVNAARSHGVEPFFIEDDKLVEALGTLDQR